MNFELILDIKNSSTTKKTCALWYYVLILLKFLLFGNLDLVAIYGH